MATNYNLKPETRNRLKKPFGTLVKGTQTQIITEIKHLIKELDPPTIISVGDMVSTNLLSHEIITQLSITDNKCMREEIQTGLFPGKKVIHIKNPPGTITQEALQAIEKALKSSKEIQLVVEGEEDLLTLAAIKYAPEKALIIYGQPNEGIVVVIASTQKKIEVEKILEEMKSVRKAK